VPWSRRKRFPSAIGSHDGKVRCGVEGEGTVALTSWGAVSLEPRRSSGDVEDVEEFVDEAHLVGDVRFTGEAMTGQVNATEPQKV
jgi:hypothetical protein